MPPSDRKAVRTALLETLAEVGDIPFFLRQSERMNECRLLTPLSAFEAICCDERLAARELWLSASVAVVGQRRPFTVAAQHLLDGVEVSTPWQVEPLADNRNCTMPALLSREAQLPVLLDDRLTPALLLRCIGPCRHAAGIGRWHLCNWWRRQCSHGLGNSHPLGHRSICSAPVACSGLCTVACACFALPAAAMAGKYTRPLPAAHGLRRGPTGCSSRSRSDCPF
mmetsp:Transcript_40025/g.85436  ORF Transcript_40025/g.85436 Transcript_40025/m.85436 type:complete len:225 (+) Transcript_40025:23-697(+)